MGKPDPDDSQALQPADADRTAGKRLSLPHFRDKETGANNGSRVIQQIKSTEDL